MNANTNHQLYQSIRSITKHFEEHGASSEKMRGQRDQPKDEIRDVYWEKENERKTEREKQRKNKYL